MLHQAQILLGSNIGDRKAYLAKAVEIIGSTIGIVTQQSRVFITPPWRIDDGNDFYNQAITIQTEHSPVQLLHALLDIEILLGRIRTGEMTSRTIDLDIAFFDDEVVASDDLTIPHPRLHIRRFALAPLNDIVPDKTHPIIGKTVSELLEGLSDQSEVTILPT